MPKSAKYLLIIAAGLLLLIVILNAGVNLRLGKGFLAQVAPGSQYASVLGPSDLPWVNLSVAIYAGHGPFTAAEDDLIRNKIANVDANAEYHQHIRSVDSDVPLGIYANISNIYLPGAVEDWEMYADGHGHDREDLYYHAALEAPWSGEGGSTNPVRFFQSVLQGDTGSFTDYTNNAWYSTNFALASTPGQFTAIGYFERYRELKVSLSTAATAGWTYVLEYPTAVDSNKVPTAWATLPILSDGTSGFLNSGTVTFDPPSNWKASKINGSMYSYFIRIRVTHAGTPPVAYFLSRDWAYSNGGASGVEKPFDASADTNGDGYLNDAEYANRASGKDARFKYESRLFTTYGQMRFVPRWTLESAKTFGVNYQKEFLNYAPLATFSSMDNSSCLTGLAAPWAAAESLATFCQDYAHLLAAIQTAIAPKAVLANTTGAPAADELVRNGISCSEEFLLRDYQTWKQFNDAASLLAGRNAAAAQAPVRPVCFLDSRTGFGIPPTDRAFLDILAYYYVIVPDPPYYSLALFVGQDPNGSLTANHYFPGLERNPGVPIEPFKEWATGLDPEDPNYTYRVYLREYTNVIAILKPDSFADYSRPDGGFGNPTATTHSLNGFAGGPFRLLNADNTLGPTITSVTLRNGEGAIVVRTSSVSTPANPVSDTTAPSVSLTAPAANATFIDNNAVTVSAGAVDNVGVVGVQFQLDGNALGSEDLTSPYAINWNAMLATNGSHVITAVARDNAGNQAISAARTVIVNNTVASVVAGPPAVGYNSPTYNTSANSTVTISKPSGVTAGDLLIAVVTIYSPGTFTSPQGWTRLFDQPTSGGNTLRVDYRVANGTEGANFSWVGSGMRPIEGAIYRITGANTSIAPLYAADGVDEGYQAAHKTPSITTTSAQNLLIWIGNLNRPRSIADVSGSANIITLDPVSGIDTSTGDTLALAYTANAGSAGNEGTATFTFGSGGNLWGGAVIAITPAPGAAAPVPVSDTTAPTVSLTAPAAGAFVSGNAVVISATAGDNVDVAGVQFKINGQNASVEDGTVPYSISWDTTGATNGVYTLTAVARDAAGNQTTSASRSVTVSNAVVQQPVNTPTQPINNPINPVNNPSANNPVNPSGVTTPSIGTFAPIGSPVKIPAPAKTPSASTPSAPASAGIKLTGVLTAPLNPGVTHSDVRLLQRFLNASGYIIAPTGLGAPGNETTFYGPKTKTALAKYQVAQGIIPSVYDPNAGLVGPKTRAAINAALGGGSTTSAPVSSPTPTTSSASATSFPLLTVPLNPGDTNAEVTTLKKILTSLGYPISNTSTFFDAETKAALIKFQEANGVINGEGLVGPMTRRAINAKITK